MSYELITRHNSRNFTPAASVPATYGRPRTIDSITIHWWGLPEWNATFEGTTDFLCTNKKPTSAHEVIEAGRVAVIVNHGDASWAAGNAVGNATSIHLELNPRANDADYATAADRIRDIRAMHGKDLPLIPHRTWQATMCPGHYDLDRLDRMARGSTITPQGTITPLEDELSAVDVENIVGAINFAFERLKNEIPADTATAVVNKQVPYKDPITGADTGQTTSLATMAGYADFQATATRLLVKRGPSDIAAQLNAAGLASAVRDELVKLLGGAK